MNKGFVKSLVLSAGIVGVLTVGIVSPNTLGPVGHAIARTGVSLGINKVYATTGGIQKSATVVPGRVYLDAGHGGSDSGAVGPNGEREAYYNDLIARETGRMLTKAGFEVVYTRIGEATMSLTQRTNKAKEYGCDILISIHMNSNTAKNGVGLETWIYDGEAKETALAKAVHNGINELGLFVDRGLKKSFDSLHVTREFPRVAILPEIGFICTQSDLDKMNDPNNRYLISRAIARGVMDYYKVDWRNDLNAKYQR